MLLAISSPADNERGAVYAEQVLAALHQANRNRLPVSLIFSRHDQTVGLYCRVPEQLESTFRQQLIARYPGLFMNRQDAKSTKAIRS